MLVLVAEAQSVEQVLEQVVVVEEEALQAREAIEHRPTLRVLLRSCPKDNSGS